MPKLDLQRSIEIDVAPDAAFAVISDLHQWRPWNPWLVTEPEAELTISEDGKHYSWCGRRTGAGEMRIVRAEAPLSVDLDLTFLKPFKSKAKVGLRITPAGKGCRVSWSMRSSIPFFLFFMKPSMQAMIAMDYDRGLGMLKDLLEEGEVVSAIEIAGSSEYPGVDYVGITRECTLDELGEQMSADWDKLRAWQREAGATLEGEPFALYLKWDLARGKVKYTSGMPVAMAPEEVPDGMVKGSLPPMKTHVVTHVGPYRHLGNAWATAMQMARGKEFAQNKAHPPFESFVNLPAEVPEKELRVSIHFPMH